MRTLEIFKLFGSIFVNNEDANKKLDDTDKKGKGVASTLGSAIGTAAKWGTAIVGAATAAGGAMLGLASKTSEYAGSILDASRKSGLTMENLQQLKFAGEQAGVSMETLVNSAARLNKTFAQAVGGSKSAKEAFAELGVSLTDASGNARNSNDVFNDTLRRLAEMGDTAEATRLGTEIFGKGFADLKPLLAEGASGIDDLKNRAKELGLVMSDEAITAGDNFGDSLEALKQSLGGMAMQFAGQFIPVLQSGIDFMMNNMPAIKDMMGGVFTALSTAFQSVTPLLADLVTNALPTLIAIFTDTATNVLPPVIALFTQIIQAVLPPLIQLFTGIIQTILPPLTDLLKVIINDILPPFIQLFTDIISTVLPPLMDLFNQIISTLLPPLIELFKQIIDAVMPVIIELFNQFTQTVLPPLMELINEIVQVILPPLLDLFNDLAQAVLPLVITVFESLLPVIEPAMKAIAAVIKTVLALIKGDWEGAWNGIKEFFSAYLDYIVKLVDGFKKVFVGIFEAIGRYVEVVWDNIVGNIKGAINYIIGGINAYIEGINSIKIPDWVPGVGGKSLNIPTIPMLAEGGEIVQKGHAVVGEAGPELLELPQGAKVKPLGNTGPSTVIVEYDGRIIAQKTIEYMPKVLRIKGALS